METLQPTKQNDIVAINNNYKVLRNEHTTNEDENEQIHSQTKIHNEQMKNITEIDKYKKTLNITSTTGHKTEHNYTLVSHTINIRKSNKGVTKEIEHISNNNSQRFKKRKTQGRKMKKQKIQLNYNKNHYT